MRCCATRATAGCCAAFAIYAALSRHDLIFVADMLASDADATPCALSLPPIFTPDTDDV